MSERITHYSLPFTTPQEQSLKALKPITDSFWFQTIWNETPFPLNPMMRHIRSWILNSPVKESRRNGHRFTDDNIDKFTPCSIGGIYLFSYGKETVYIGKALVDLRGRLRKHLRGGSFGPGPWVPSNLGEKVFRHLNLPIPMDDKPSRFDLVPRPRPHDECCRLLSGAVMSCFTFRLRSVGSEDGKIKSEERRLIAKYNPVYNG